MDLLADLSILLAFTCLVSFLIYLVRFPLVLGYILVGILAGPYFLNIIPSTTTLNLFSNIGIIALLFIIGLSLNPKTIKSDARESLVLGISQVIFTTLAGFVLLYFIFHLSVIASILLGLALAFSSTIIILKILSDKKDIEKLYAKMSLGVLLIQDIFVAFVLILLSTLHLVSEGGSAISIIIPFILKILILYFVYLLFAKLILPRTFKIFARSQELLLLFSVVVAFLYAFLFDSFGFSLELGALFAGIILSTSPFAKEIISRFKPIRDFFLIIFFILLGYQVQFGDLSQSVWLIIVLSFFVIILKPLILFLIMNLSGHKTRTSFYTALTVGQVSAFSLIILTLAKSYGYVSESAFSTILLVMLISISVSSYLLIYNDKVYRLLRKPLLALEFRKNQKEFDIHENQNWDLVIFGYDRVGKKFLDLARAKNYNYVIVDINPKAIQQAESDGGETLFGDASDINFLEENHILDARMIVSTIPDFEINLELVEFYKKRRGENNQKRIIIVVAQREAQAKTMYQAGADYVILPYHIGAEEAANYIEKFAFDENKFRAARQKHLTRLS